jgi:Rieske Fe-S protein
MQKGLFRCPCHEGWFDIATGNNVAGPPPRPLARVSLSVENGEIWATRFDERAA